MLTTNATALGLLPPQASGGGEGGGMAGVSSFNAQTGAVLGFTVSNGAPSNTPTPPDGAINIDNTTFEIYEANGGTYSDTGDQLALIGASPTCVSSIGAATGDITLGTGIGLTVGRLSNTGVTSVTGPAMGAQTGALTLAQGASIRIAVSGSPATYTINALTPVQGEVPTGAVNGVNQSFGLANGPSPVTVALYLAGVRQAPSLYTLSGQTVTFAVAPVTGLLLADYTYAT